MKSGLLASCWDGKFCTIPRQSPRIGSLGFLVLLVEHKTWNQGCSVPAMMGSSVWFPGYPHPLECRPGCSASFTWSCRTRWSSGLLGLRYSWCSWWKGRSGIWSSRFPTRWETLCSFQGITGNGYDCVLVSLVEEKNWNLHYSAPAHVLFPGNSNALDPLVSWYCW